MSMSAVRVVSQETVKPSSPTPSHLRTYKLSWLDQHLFLSHIPVTLFYLDGGRNESIGRLKSSLSETLTRFYPLAGRLVWNSHVDCNDDGVEFYEARVDGPLNRAIQQIDLDLGLGLVNQLLPCARSCCNSSGSNILLSVQVNVFDCHGIVIGVCLSHKIADGCSLLHFLQSWTGAASAEPAFDAVRHFPPAKEVASPWTKQEQDDTTVVVRKRFVFDASHIAAMKSKSKSSSVMAVVGLIWRCIIRARAKASGEPNRGSVATLSVDTRGRVEPPWPDCSFGNHCILSAAAAMATATATAASIKEEGEEEEEKEGVLEERFRSSVRAITSPEYLRRLQGEDGFTVALDEFKQAMGKCVGGGFDLYFFTSWLRFPLYEVDFGWGKPIFVCSSNTADNNFIYLMPRKEGEGVEAWVALEEKHMAEFERDDELLPFASHRIQLDYKPQPQPQP